MNQVEILVSGATGRTGGTAIDELIKMGRRVRAYVRSDEVFRPSGMTELYRGHSVLWVCSIDRRAHIWR